MTPGPFDGGGEDSEFVEDQSDIADAGSEAAWRLRNAQPGEKINVDAVISEYLDNHICDGETCEPHWDSSHFDQAKEALEERLVEEPELCRKSLPSGPRPRSRYQADDGSSPPASFDRIP